MPYVDVDMLRDGAMAVRSYAETLDANLGQYERVVWELYGSFGNDPSGHAMRQQYDQLAGPLSATGEGISGAVARAGETGFHSANAFESTNQGFNFHGPPGGHETGRPGGVTPAEGHPSPGIVK